MKLYDTTFAPNPRRVRIFAAEKGVSIPSVQIDIGKLEHTSAAYAAVNPRRRVPALELEDGVIIAESMAICRYLEALHPEPNLLGRTPREIGEIDMWSRQIEFDFYLTIAAAFRHLHPAMAARETPQIPAWGERNRARLLDELAVLDDRLSGREFVACDRFTVADITALVAVDFLRVTKVAIPDGMAELKRWKAAVSARPSAAA